MGKYFFIVIIVLLNCKSKNNAIENSFCDELNEKTAELVFRYQVFKDSLALDSALYLIEMSINQCPKFESLLRMRWLGILSNKREYEKAITYVDTSSLIFFRDITYFNSFLQNKFRAMDAYSKGDMTTCNIYLQKIDSEIISFLEKNNEEKITFLNEKNINNMTNSPMFFVFVQYFSNKFYLEGEVSVRGELDNLKRSGINGEFIEMIEPYLENNFLDFYGY